MNRQYMDFIPQRPKTAAPQPQAETVVQIKTQPTQQVIVKETELKVTKSESFSIPQKPVAPPVQPQAHFIKTNVAKRPLSPNVYSKPIPETPKEEKSGPVAIINQPKKESHIGFIITVILVIILGAAAGTVAFFLLPR